MYPSHLFAVMPPLLPPFIWPACTNSSAFYLSAWHPAWPLTCLSASLPIGCFLKANHLPTPCLQLSSLPVLCLPSCLSVSHSASLRLPVILSFCLLVHMPLINPNILSDCCCPVHLCLPAALLLFCLSVTAPACVFVILLAASDLSALLQDCWLLSACLRLIDQTYLLFLLGGQLWSGPAKYYDACLTKKPNYC